MRYVLQMQQSVTPAEILSVYTFDPAFFFGGAAAFFFIALFLLIALAVIVPFVVRSRPTSDAIGSVLVRKGIAAVIVLSVVGGYFYQDFQRRSFADALANVPPEHGVTDIGAADIHGNITMNIGKNSYRVPGAAAYALRDKIFKPRHIVFDVPEMIQKEP